MGNPRQGMAQGQVPGHNWGKFRSTGAFPSWAGARDDASGVGVRPARADWLRKALENGTRAEIGWPRFTEVGGTRLADQERKKKEKLWIFVRRTCLLTLGCFGDFRRMVHGALSGSARAGQWAQLLGSPVSRCRCRCRCGAPGPSAQMPGSGVMSWPAPLAQLHNSEIQVPELRSTAYIAHVHRQK